MRDPLEIRETGGATEDPESASDVTRDRRAGRSTGRHRIVEPERPGAVYRGHECTSEEVVVVRALRVIALVGCVAASSCGGSGSAAPAKTSDRITVRGTATLDGAPFDAEFLGAIVRRDGLITPCQAEIPPVTSGHYAIDVLAQRAGRGCGARGAQVSLWTFAGGTKLYSKSAVAWPRRGNVANFDPQFSTTMRRGDVPAVTELSGEVFNRRGRRLPPGTRVEAYIGTTRCGVASVRRAGTFTGYILSVVGPDSINACTEGAQITFRINGRPAAETHLNDLTGGAPGSGGSFRLTQS